jgi:hypothetical protein
MSRCCDRRDVLVPGLLERGLGAYQAMSDLDEFRLEVSEKVTVGIEGRELFTLTKQHALYKIDVIVGDCVVDCKVCITTNNSTVQS